MLKKIIKNIDAFGQSSGIPLDGSKVSGAYLQYKSKEIQSVSGVINSPHAMLLINDSILFVGSRSDYIFGLFDADDITSYQLSATLSGPINTAFYDADLNLVFFFSGNDLYSVNPLDISTLTLITTYSVGTSPAIVSDGTYIYGVTCFGGPDETFFQINIGTGTVVNTNTWVGANFGHSAAIYKYPDPIKTELYFTAAFSNNFAKVNPQTLAYTEVKLNTNTITDDIAYQNIDDTYGYVYVASETDPIGARIKTDTLEVTNFFAPITYCVQTDGKDLYITDINDSQIYKYVDFDLENYEIYTLNNTREIQKIDFEGKTPITGQLRLELFGVGVLTGTIDYNYQLSQIKDAIRNSSNFLATGYLNVWGSFKEGIYIEYLRSSTSPGLAIVDTNTLEDISGPINVTVSVDTALNIDVQPNEFQMRPNGEFYYTTWLGASKLTRATFTKHLNYDANYSLKSGSLNKNNKPFSTVFGRNSINDSYDSAVIGSNIVNYGNRSVVAGDNTVNTKDDVFKFKKVTIDQNGVMFDGEEDAAGQASVSAPICAKSKYHELTVQEPTSSSYFEEVSGPYMTGDNVDYFIYQYYYSDVEGMLYSDSYLQQSLTVSSDNVAIKLIINKQYDVLNPYTFDPTGYRIIRNIGGIYAGYTDVAISSDPTTFMDDNVSLWKKGTAVITPTKIYENMSTGGGEFWGKLNVNAEIKAPSQVNLNGSISTKTRLVGDSGQIAPNDHVIYVINPEVFLSLPPASDCGNRQYIVKNTSLGFTTLSCYSGDIFDNQLTLVILGPNDSVILEQSSTTSWAIASDNRKSIKVFEDQYFNKINDEWAQESGSSGSISFLNRKNGWVRLITTGTSGDYIEYDFDGVYNFSTDVFSKLSVRVIANSISTITSIGFKGSDPAEDYIKVVLSDDAYVHLKIKQDSVAEEDIYIDSQPWMLLINEVSGDGNLATITTLLPHGLKTGDRVTVKTAAHAAFDQEYASVTVTGDYSFTYINSTVLSPAKTDAGYVFREMEIDVVSDGLYNYYLFVNGVKSSTNININYPLVLMQPFKRTEVTDDLIGSADIDKISIYQYDWAIFAVSLI